MYKIDKNIPLPEVKKEKQSKFGFYDLELGDSIFMPESDIKATTVRSNMTYFNKRNKQKLIFRKVVEEGINGFRVWRIV